VGAGTWQGKLYLVELGSGKHLSALDCGGVPVWAVAFSTCGRYVAASCRFRPEILLFDLDQIHQVAPPPVRTDKQREERWRELLSGDAARAHRAFVALANSSATVAFLDDKLRLPAKRKAQVERLVRQLDAEAFATRDRAEQQLSRLGREAEGALHRELAINPSAELRWRGARLLKPLEGPVAWARRGRVLDLLERIGTPQARALLEHISKEHAQGWQGVEAREALERLARRGLGKEANKP
jgi:hypothetical protein